MAFMSDLEIYIFRHKSIAIASYNRQNTEILEALHISSKHIINMRPDGPRDPVAGPDSGPEAPFPIKLWGPVIRGFGRGSKEVSFSYTSKPSMRAVESANSRLNQVNHGVLLWPKLEISRLRFRVIDLGT